MHIHRCAHRGQLWANNPAAAWSEPDAHLITSLQTPDRAQLGIVSHWVTGHTAGLTSHTPLWFHPPTFYSKNLSKFLELRQTIWVSRCSGFCSWDVCLMQSCKIKTKIKINKSKCAHLHSLLTYSWCVHWFRVKIGCLILSCLLKYGG